MLDLDVYLEGAEAPVGRLSRNDEGNLAFAYAHDALAHPLSLSLPVREEPFGDVAARGFFSNLLFENAQRDDVMARHRLDFSDIAGLLYHLGRDCPGALSVVPQGEEPGKRPGILSEDYEPLVAEDLRAIMTSLRDRRRVPDGTGDPSPLAGIQGKLAVTRLADGRLALPRTGTGAPTTHILKVPQRRDARLVDHEHVLMEIAGRVLSHPVAGTEILEGEVRGLLVTRFDREVTEGAVRRVHQEDFCQAMGLLPQLKYECNGLPAHRFDAPAIGGLLARCEHPGPARQAFLEATLVNLLLGNTDNHAKNHALVYHGPRPAFAPLYDIVPVLADDTVTHEMGFRIGAARVADDITRNDLEAFAAHIGMRRLTPGQSRRLSDVLAACAAEIPGLRGPAFKRLGDIISQQARHIAPALGGKIDIPARDMVVINRP